MKLDLRNRLPKPLTLRDFLDATKDSSVDTVVLTKDEQRQLYNCLRDPMVARVGDEIGTVEVVRWRGIQIEAI